MLIALEFRLRSWEKAAPAGPSVTVTRSCVSPARKQADDLKAFFKTNPPAGHQLETAQHLHLVADTLVEAQQQRHTADYDGAATWMRTEVVSLIELVESAFKSWHAIREEPIAQIYLISLLGNPKG
jgi:hypothetical protein